MRIKTPLTRENIRNHFTYSLWKYALVAVAAIFGWSLIYTVTAYRSPQDKRIDLYVQSSTATSETIDAFIQPIWEATVPEMEAVQSVTLMASDEYSTTMQLTTYIYAGEGDIYFLTEQYFKSLASTGAFLPLEGLVEDGTLQLEGIDLKKGYITMVDEYNDQDQPVRTSQHLFGIPLDTFYGYMNGMLLDNRGMYAVVLVNNQNDENVIPFFNALLQAGKGEKENWINE
ncbi:MAG: hypothetical protein GX637_00495 [Clostridiales bacterium]|nr:hypothetical protein [Clostridiales bacterium]